MHKLMLATKLAVIFVMVCAMLSLTHPASSDESLTDGKDTVVLTGSTWKKVEKADGSKDVISYGKFFEEPYQQWNRNFEPAPDGMKTLHYYPYKKTETPFRFYSPQGWLQDGRNLEIYPAPAQSKAVYKCRFIDENTIKGSLKSPVDGRVYDIEMTRVADAEVIKRINSFDARLVPPTKGSKAATQETPCRINVVNKCNALVTVEVCRAGAMDPSAIKWVATPNTDTPFYFPEGKYEIRMVFSDKQSDVYRAQDIYLNQGGLTITITRDTAGRGWVETK